MQALTLNFLPYFRKNKSTMPSLKQQIEHAKTLFDGENIPALPKEIIQLNTLLSDSHLPEVKVIANLISQNINLTAEVIKTANYPVFSKNRATEVTSIKEAVDVLGIKNLRSLVMGIYYSMEYLGRARAEINQLSLNAASLCGFLSHRVMGINSDKAYLAGLFYNAGAILMATKFKDYDDVFMETIRSPYQSKTIENECYGTSRNIAGLLLAKDWQLGKTIGHVIYLANKKKLQDIEEDNIRALVALIQLCQACITKKEMPDCYTDEVEAMYQNAQTELLIDDEDILEACHLLFPLQT